MGITAEKGVLRVDVPLTNVAIGYSPVSDFPLALGGAFPIVPVDKETGKYFKFDKNSFRTANGTWKPGTTGKRVVPYTASTDNYACERYKLVGTVTDDEVANAAKAIMPRIRVTKDVSDMVLRYFEQKICTALLDSSGTYSSYTAAASFAWNTDSSDPKADVNDAKNSIRKNAAVKPSQVIMIIGYDKFQDLQNHPSVKDQIKYTSSKSVTAEILAEYFQVRKVIVHDEVYDSSAEGQNASMSDMWDSTKVTLLWTPGRPDLKTPSAGYLAVEKLYGGAGSRVRRFPDEDKTKEQELIEVMKSMAVIETANEAVYIITGA